MAPAKITQEDKQTRLNVEDPNKGIPADLLSFINQQRHQKFVLE
jgi:hypothetical protein